MMLHNVMIKWLLQQMLGIYKLISHDKYSLRVFSTLHLINQNSFVIATKQVEIAIIKASAECSKFQTLL